jgi:hypothetical protein
MNFVELEIRGYEMKDEREYMLYFVENRTCITRSRTVVRLSPIPPFHPTAELGRPLPAGLFRGPHWQNSKLGGLSLGER